MTLFTTLLVLIAERLFKLGEHWQLDHRLEVVFRRIKHFSLPGTLLMTLVAVAVVYIIQRLLQGQLFNIPLLVFWILLGLLCIGAGKVRLHYHAYLKAASRNDSRACDAMASELTLIHGVPPVMSVSTLANCKMRCCGLTIDTIWRRFSGLSWGAPGAR